MSISFFKIQREDILGISPLPFRINKSKFKLTTKSFVESNTFLLLPDWESKIKNLSRFDFSRWSECSSYRISLKVGILKMPLISGKKKMKGKNFKVRLMVISFFKYFDNSLFDTSEESLVKIFLYRAGENQEGFLALSWVPQKGFLGSPLENSWKVSFLKSIYFPIEQCNFMI